MITSNVLERLFFIRFGNATATCFTIVVDNREYIITAKHVVEQIGAEDTIQLKLNNQWINLDVKLVGHAEDDVDISVLSTDRVLTPANHPMQPTSKGMIYGQDMYFLGYPFGWTGELTMAGNGGSPLPFVKKAILALLGGKTFYLDGHNNKGFSGGPVIFKNANGPNEFKVGGVISGYTAVEQPVLHEGRKTPLIVQDNTGIISVMDINGAVKVIKDNPIGCPIS
ncbi:MAG: serine protease [Sneathiella sp.]